MADPRFDIWNVLHDGEITVIALEKPETLVMFVDIPYVRQRIGPLGDSFRLELRGFRSIQFANDIGDSSREIADIARKRLIIISKRSETMPLQVEVAQGTLTLDFDSVRISLDTGQPISFGEVDRLSADYWTEWRKNTA
jgi:hypothetical protein